MRVVFGLVAAMMVDGWAGAQVLRGDRLPEGPDRALIAGRTPTWSGRGWYMQRHERREAARKEALRAAVSRLLEQAERAREEERNEFVIAGLKLDTSRTLATIYSAEAGDFPEVANLFLRDSGTVRPAEYELLEPVIRRWCDFDPKAALEWLYRHVPWTWYTSHLLSDGVGGLGSIIGHLECVIAEEAIDDFPEWALALRRWTTWKEYNVEHHYRAERFLYHLAKGQAERSAAWLEKLDDRLVEYSFGGWLDGMIELDLVAQAEAVIATAGGEKREMWEDMLLDCLLKKKPAEARRREESGMAPEWLDREVALNMRDEEGEEAAVKWFMARAPENPVSRERAERIGEVVEHLILVHSDQVEWVEEMKDRGEDVSFASGVLAKRAAKDGRMKDAYRFLEKTREFIKKEVTEAVLREEMEEITLIARKDYLYRFGVYLPAPGARERVEQAGLSDEFQRLLRGRNVDSWSYLVKWMEQSHAELEAVLKEVREAVSGEGADD